MNTNIYLAITPDGQKILLPTALDIATDIYSQFNTKEHYLSYYQTQGYVICRNLISPMLCEQVKRAFQQTIKPISDYFYRQVTAQPEQHHFNLYGYVLNGLLNIQDLNSCRFAAFKQAGLAILTDAKLIEMICHLLGEQGILVQSMFFEGNSETWPHQDTYYLDASEVGKMVGIWVALEDISAPSGRFFVYPQSHHLNMIKQSEEFAIAFNHAAYKQKILEIIKTTQLSCYAPSLQQGDVLFWNSRTIHGSLKTDDLSLSRCSLTAHYIPQSSQLLQYHKRIISLKLETVNQILVHHPKNLDQWHYQMMFQLEIRFPQLFQKLKKRLIQLLIDHS